MTTGPQPGTSASAVRAVAVGGANDGIVNTGDNVTFNIGGDDVRVRDLLQDVEGLEQILEVQHFSGREWLHEEIAAARCGDGSVILLGADAGWGKSAFAADLARRGAVCVFGRLLRDVTSRDEVYGAFAAAAALAAGASPEDPVDPAWLRPAGFRGHLAECAARLPGGRLLMVLDGADELGDVDLASLSLVPVPEGCDLLVTFRTGHAPTVATRATTILPETRDDRNLADLDAYLAARLGSAEATGPLAAARVTADAARERLLAASAGLWIYAVMVLRDFLSGRRADLDALPDGLLGYYTEVVRRVRRGPGWMTERLPVLAALGACREPSPVSRIAAAAGITPAVAAGILNGTWAPVAARVTRAGGDDVFAPYHGSLQRLLDGVWPAERGPYDDVVAELREASRAAHRVLAVGLPQRFGGIDAGLPGLVPALRARDAEARYAASHLAEHAIRGGDPGLLFRLLTVPAPEGDSAGRPESMWAVAQRAAGAPGRFLRDVRAAEDALRDRVAAEAADGGPVPSLGAFVGATALRVALLSSARNVPPALLARLVATGSLSVDAAANLARATPHPTQAAEALIAVAAEPSCPDSLAATLRVEAVQRASDASPEAFATCVRPVVRDVPEAVAATLLGYCEVHTPGVAEEFGADVVQRLVETVADGADLEHQVLSAVARTSPKVAAAHFEARDSGDVTERVLSLASAVTILAAGPPHDAAEHFAGRLRAALDELPERYPVRRLAGQAALALATAADPGPVFEAAATLVSRGYGVYVASYAGHTLLALAPDRVLELLSEDDTFGWHEVIVGAENVPATLRAALHRAERAVRETWPRASAEAAGALVDEFVASGTLPPDDGPLDAGFRQERIDAFVATATPRCPPEFLPRLIGYARPSIGWRTDVVKAAVARAVEEGIDVFDEVLALENDPLRAAALSVLAPTLSRPRAEAAFDAKRRDPDPALFSVLRHMLGAGGQQIDATRAAAEEVADVVRRHTEGLRIDHDLFVAALVERDPVGLRDEHGRPPDGTPDLAAALALLPESWTAATMEELHDLLATEVEPARCLALARRVGEPGWRVLAAAVAASATLGRVGPHEEAVRVRLASDAVDGVCRDDEWVDVDISYRVSALRRAAAATDRIGRRRLLDRAAAAADERLRRASIKACGDTVGQDEARRLLAALDQDSLDEFGDAAEVVGALVARLPADEIAAGLARYDVWTRDGAVGNAAPLAPPDVLEVLLARAAEIAAPDDRALTLTAVAAGIRERGPEALRARADALRDDAVAGTPDTLFRLPGTVLRMLGNTPAASPSHDHLLAAAAAAAARSSDDVALRQVRARLLAMPPHRALPTLLAALDALAGSADRMTASQWTTLLDGLVALVPVLTHVGGDGAAADVATVVTLTGPAAAPGP